MDGERLSAYLKLPGTDSAVKGVTGIDFTLATRIGKPSNSGDWDAIAETNGNLLQATYFDAVEDFFRLTPIYFEVYKNGALMGGVKLYHRANKRKVFRGISSSLRQLGEIIYDDNRVDIRDIQPLLQAEVLKFIESNKIVFINIFGNYGDLRLLLSFDRRAEDVFDHDVAFFDLTQDVEQLKSNLHKGHKRSIEKAMRMQLTMAESDDIDAFLEIFGETYRRQNKTGPDHAFIKHTYVCLNKKGFVKIYFIYENGVKIAGIMLNRFGPNAYGLFSGYLSNDKGAGTFMLWSVALELKRQGIEKFILGQTAKVKEGDNTKFTVGISGFKERFGVSKIESTNATFIFRPLAHRLWESIIAFRKRLPA